GGDGHPVAGTTGTGGPVAAADPVDARARRAGVGRTAVRGPVGDPGRGTPGAALPRRVRPAAFTDARGAAGADRLLHRRRRPGRGLRAAEAVLAVLRRVQRDRSAGRVAAGRPYRRRPA